MFPPGEMGRIPLVAVTGSKGKTATARLIGTILERGAGPVAVATSEGVFRDGKLVKPGNASGYDGAQAVLQHPLVEWAVCEVAAESVRDEGLGFDDCEVAVVTCVDQAHCEDLPDAERAEQVSVLKRCVVEAVAKQRGWAVLNADDPTTAAMAEYCRGSLIYFTRDPRNAIALAHAPKGGAWS